MKRCSITDFALGLVTVLFFGLSFCLLVIEDYFSLSDLEGVDFGLSGASIDNSFYSYTELIDFCDPLHLLKDYCESLEDLQNAGKAYRAMLIIDLIAITLFATEIILLNFVLLGVFVYRSLSLSGETLVSEKGIGVLLPIISIVFLALANKAIKKDEDLVKSVDRLR